MMGAYEYQRAKQMIDAIPRLHDAVGAFFNDHIEGVFPKSPASEETNGFPDPEIIRTAYSQGNALIDVADDHMIVFSKSLTEPAHTFAPWACVRAALEAGALASWFLDPSIDSRERAKRSFAFRYEGLDQQIKFLGSLKAEGAMFDPLKARVEEVEAKAVQLGFPQLRDKKGNRNGIGMRMPSITQLIGEVFDDEPTYRLLSAMAHGHHWALVRLGYKFHEADDGKSEYAKLVKHISPESVGYLASKAVKAFVRPVWYRSRQQGWDTGRLRRILDEAYDAMRLNDKDRFWRIEDPARSAESSE